MVSLGGLSGLGGVYPGYIKTMKDSAEARSADYDADMKVAGDQAFVNSLQGFNTNPPPGGTPMAPGQPSVPGGPSPMQGGPGGSGGPGPVSTGVVPGPGGGSLPPPGGGPPSPGGAGGLSFLRPDGSFGPPPGGAGSFGPPGGGNGPPSGAGGGGPVPQGGGGPNAPAGSVAGAVGAPGQVVSPGDFLSGGQPARPMPQQPFQIPGQQGQGQGGLDWRTVLQHVIQSNPGAPPGAIAYAVNKWLPVMNAASQEQWRQVQQQIREQGLQNQIDIQRMRGDVALAGQKSREHIAELNNDTKMKLEAARAADKLDLAKFNAQEKRDISAMNYEERRALLGDKLAAQWDQLVYKEQAQDTRQDKRLAVSLEKLDKTLAAHREQYTYLAASREKISELSVMAREEIAKRAEEGRNNRADLSNNTKRELAEKGIDARRMLQEFLEAGRDRRAQAQILSREQIADIRNKAIQGRFDAREARLAWQNAVHEDDVAASRTLARERFEQQVRNQGGHQAILAWRAALNAEHNRNMEAIQMWSLNTGMPTKFRDAMLQSEFQFYNEKIKEIQAYTGGTLDFAPQFKPPGAGKSPDQVPAGNPAAGPGGGFKITPIGPGAGAQGTP